MENFLSNFANTNTEVKSNNANVSVSPEFYGTIDVSKGALTMKIHFYTRVYKMKYENCISLDDWDINDTTDISFGGVPIDDLKALKTTMINSGLTTVAKGLDISSDEHEKEICIQLEQHKAFKDIFGKKARMFKLLSDQEKTNAKLKFAIDNYDKITINNSDMQDLLIIDEEGNKSLPTLEQLTNQLNK
jgi:hypothetical protein